MRRGATHLEELQILGKSLGMALGSPYTHPREGKALALLGVRGEEATSAGDAAAAAGTA